MREHFNVSVAIAAYNGAPFILEQLQSIEAQTLKPREIVVCDDASVDQTVAVVEHFAARSVIPVRIHRQRVHVGAFENFRKALSMCTGAHIAYCDQDDAWKPHKLERVARALATDGIVLAMHQSVVCDAQLRDLNGLVIPNLREGRYRWSGPGGPLWGHAHQMVFERELWELTAELLANPIEPKPQFMTNFDAMLLTVAGVVGHVWLIAEPLTRFRRHPQALSGAGKMEAEVAAASRLRRPLARQQHFMEWNLRNAIEWRLFLSMPLCRELIDAQASRRGSQSASQYLSRLDERLAATQTRLEIYRSPSVCKRSVSLLRLIGRGAFGDVHVGKLRRKLLLVDMIAAAVPPRRVA